MWGIDLLMDADVGEGGVKNQPKIAAQFMDGPKVNWKFLNLELLIFINIYETLKFSIIMFTFMQKSLLPRGFQL